MNEKTIITYRVTYQTPDGRNFDQWLTTRDDAEKFAAQFPGTTTVTEHPRVFRVGQTLQVRAFGRWRPGRVVAVGRTRVQVNYVRNQSGGHAERWFYPAETR